MVRSEMRNRDLNLRMNRERTQVIVLIAIGMIVLIAVVGLATDATIIYKAKQDL
jgi:hypothetical protein